MASRRRSTRRRRRQPLRRVPEHVAPEGVDGVRAGPVERLGARGDVLPLPGLPFLKRDLLVSLVVIALLVVGLVVAALVL